MYVLELFFLGEAVAFTKVYSYLQSYPYVFPYPDLTQAFGLGAMLLASGQKGHRSALPNASIMLQQPRSMARGQASDIAIKAKEVGEQNFIFLPPSSCRNTTILLIVT